jgi:hypothetical protein
MDPRDVNKMMIRPGKYGPSINWDWKDWTGLIVSVVVIVGLLRGDSALAFLKLIGNALTSIVHR